MKKVNKVILVLSFIFLTNYATTESDFKNSEYSKSNFATAFANQVPCYFRKNLLIAKNKNLKQE